MRPRVSASAAVLQRRQAALRSSPGASSHHHHHHHAHQQSNQPHAPPPCYGSSSLSSASSLSGSLLLARCLPPLPELPADSGLLFEVIVFAYCMVAMLLQLLHLYRSVFWLPHSYNANAVNWYLIEWHLLSFAGIFLGRRLLWSCLKWLLSALTPQSWTQSFVIVARSLVTAAVPAALFLLIYFKMGQYPMANLLYLAYPVAVYFCLFGFEAEPFLELLPNGGSCSADGGKGRLTRDRQGRLRAAPTTPSPTSSSSPEGVRLESGLMRSDFNTRMRQVAFNSICGAYYTTFVPCAFSQSFLHYERSWVGRHVMLVWVGCFSLYVVQCFPGSYVHALHKCAAYLGRWRKTDGKMSPTFYNAWTPHTFWPRGSIVRHGKDLFKAEGATNAAAPDDLGQARFYTLFQDASLFSWMSLIVQSGLVLAQHVSLTWSTHWYMLISESILLFANYYALFKVLRDYLVFTKVNSVEGKLVEQVEESQGKN